MVLPSQGKLLYHLSRLTNFESIARRGLLSRDDLVAHGLAFDDVADPAILAKRERHRLASYVPFHFFPRNPFDYSVCRTHPDEPMALFGVQRARAQERGWMIVPRHPLADDAHGPGEPLPWSQGYLAIDWALLDRENRDYSDRECKVACMAEALSPTPVPLELVTRIYVKDHEDAAFARQFIRSSWPKIEVVRGMFP